MQTEAEAFLQRIRAFPDDDAPRLVFADWLDEQRESTGGWGPDRAMFIRVQIALAQLAAEATAAREREGIALLERDGSQGDLLLAEGQLLDRYRDLWAAPFHGLATGLEFRRGFVEEVKVAARQLVRNANELFATGPVRHIHLLDVGGSLASVLACPYLSRLAAFTIHASHAGEPLARAVASAETLRGLRQLHLTRNRFADTSAEYLANSPVLAGIEELDLSENELSETAALALAASPHFVAVRCLEFRSNRLGPAGAEALAGSERFPALRRLGLSANEVGSARLHSLGRIHQLLRIPELDLSLNGLTAEGVRAIFHASHSEHEIRLRELDLSHNELGDAGAQTLAAAPGLEAVRVLRLAGCGIGDDGARAIAASQHLNRLVQLDLGNNPINDSGFRPFLEASQLRSLRQIIVPGIGVSLRMRRALEMYFARGRG